MTDRYIRSAMSSQPRLRFHRALRLLIPLIVFATLLLLPGLVVAEDGYATWYGQPFHGRYMANGQVFDMNDPTTTACNIYPFGTWLKVTNPANGKSVVVQVRDRGGFSHALDLSYAAFKAIADPAVSGIKVKYEVVTGPGGEPVATAAPNAAPKVEAKAAPTQVAATPAASATIKPSEYTVTQGDTLFSIAQRFGLDVDSLASWNGITNPDTLATGEVLSLHAPAAPAAATTPHAPAARASGNTYVVAEGDTLWSIAIAYDTTPEELAELNGLSEDSVIVIGDQLQVPGAASTGVSQPTSGSATRGAPSRYVVQEGDTLLGIAVAHDTTAEALMQLNDLDESDFLQIGQELAMP